MKQKKTNSSMKPKKETSKARDREFKRCKWLEEYRDCFSFKMKPVTEAFITRISSELVAWAENEETLKVSPFYLKKGIDYRTWNRWRAKYEEIDLATRYAAMVIGNRREEGALKKKLDSGIVSYTMPMYDPEWKEIVAWRAKLKEDNKESTGEKIVIIEKMPDTGIPPKE